MRILFIEPRFHTNQIHWVKKLINEDHQVLMHVTNIGFTEDHSIIIPELQEPCLFSKLINNFFFSSNINNSRNFPNPFKYFVNIYNLKPDIIIVRDINRPLSLIGAICGRILSKKIIIYSQTEIYKFYSYKRKFIFSAIINLFKASWISPLTGNKKDFDYKPKKMFFIPFSVKIRRDSTENVNKKKLNILMIGKFEKRKNHILLLKALLNIHEEYKLTIVGEVTNDAHKKQTNIIENFIEDNNLNERVTIKKNILFSDIEKYYKISDFFILPSTREPASISVVEALGMGLPTICSNTNGTRCYIREGETGYTFLDNSIEDLEKKIRLMLNRDTLKNMKRKIREDNDPIYSSNYFYKCFFNLLKG
tara:strand:- start:1022 stop:2113 length:1092 start_codon:yes stop_codon:yes gene_type:complete